MIAALAMACAGPSAEGKRAKGSKMTTSKDSAVVEHARAAAAKAVNAPPASVHVELLSDAGAKGVVPFRAYVTSEEGGRTGHRVGVVEGDKAVADRAAAITKVVRAWHYDASRPVKVREVARVLGFLMGDFAETNALLDDKDLAHLRPDYRKLVHAPSEITNEGAPGVEFWINAASDADLGPPLFRVQVLVPPAGDAHVTMKQISDLLE